MDSGWARSRAGSVPPDRLLHLLIMVLYPMPDGVAAVPGGIIPHQPQYTDLPPSPEAEPTSDLLPYERKRYLLTQNERIFYDVLIQAIPPDHVLFTQIRLPSLIYVPQSTAHRQAHYNRILAKTVDFVICVTPTLSPRLVIELDDSSHQRPERQERDKLVDAVLASAGLPILHVPVQGRYDVAELAEQIKAALGSD